MGTLGSLGSDPVVVAVCGVVLVVGACVQGVLGFGLALTAVPVLALLAPSLVPVGVLVAIMPLVVVQAVQERAHLDLRGIGWALVGRLPGGTAGAVAVVLLPVRGLQVLVAATVLLAVAAAVLADARQVGVARAAPRRSGLVLAGALSGFGGTTSGIGGPPMAVAFRNSGGPAIRATLSLFFLVGSVLSVATLALLGEVTWPGLAAGLVLLPFVAVGYLSAGALRGRLDAQVVRLAVLVISTVSGSVLLGAALIC